MRWINAQHIETVKVRKADQSLDCGSGAIVNQVAPSAVAALVRGDYGLLMQLRQRQLEQLGA